MIVIKPQMTGPDTSLLVTTDRRASYLRLISKADDDLARVHSRTWKWRRSDGRRINWKSSNARTHWRLRAFRDLESAKVVSAEEKMVRDTTITLPKTLHKRVKKAAEDREADEHHGWYGSRSPAGVEAGPNTGMKRRATQPE